MKTGETGVVVDRLPPGRPCVETEEDERGLAVFLHAIEQAQAMDRQDVRRRAVEEYDCERITGQVIAAPAEVRAELTAELPAASVLLTQARQHTPQTTKTEADLRQTPFSPGTTDN